MHSESFSIHASFQLCLISYSNSSLENFTHEYVAEREQEREQECEDLKAKPANNGTVGSGDPIDVGTRNYSARDRDASILRPRIRDHFIEGFSTLSLLTHSHSQTDMQLVELADKSTGVHPTIRSLPWSTMTKALVDRGLYLKGWPAGVEFPDETKKQGQQSKSQGLKDLGLPAQRALLDALDFQTMTFENGDRRGTSF
jgi:hypothetical protein